MTWGDMPKHWYADYERGRPGYPLEAVEAAGLEYSAHVLDIGAGTGKLTRLLASTYAKVTAIEPDDEMRRLLAESCPETEIDRGTADQIPLADGSVDGAFAAQAFHWFDNEPALREIARVLRRGGAVVLIWNVPAGAIDPPIPAVEQLLTEFWPGGWALPLDMSLNDYTPAAWDLPFVKRSFEEHRELIAPNPQKADPEDVVAFLNSMGWIAALPEADRLSLLERVRQLLTADQYVLPWETHVHWTRLCRTDG